MTVNGVLMTSFGTPGLCPFGRSLDLVCRQKGLACLKHILRIHVSGNPVKQSLAETLLDIRSDDEDDLSISGLLRIENTVVQQRLSVHSYRIYLLDSAIAGSQTCCKYQQ